jgi:hypothetical protein
MEFFPRFFTRWNLVTGATVVGGGLAAGFFGLLYWNPV